MASASTIEVKAVPNDHPMTNMPSGGVVPGGDGGGVQLTPRFFPVTETIPIVDGKPVVTPAPGPNSTTLFSDVSASGKPTSPAASRTDDTKSPGQATPRDVQVAVNAKEMELAAAGHVYQIHELFPGRVKPVPPPGTTCCGGPLPPLPVNSFAKLDAAAEGKMEHVAITSVVIIYNPFSGNGRAAREYKVLVSLLEEAKIKVTERKTERAGHATELAEKEAMDGHHAFVVIGGDGTFHEFINGYMKRTKQQFNPPVGFIAGGTGNSVLTSLGLTDTKEAAKMVIRGAVRRIDLGHVTTLPDNGHGKYWVNLIGWGVGVDANIVAESCRCCGPARYNFGGMVTVFQNKTRNATVEVDGCKIPGPFDVLFIQNNPHAGSSLRIAPYAHVNDGLLDAVILPHRCCCSVLGMFEDLKNNGAHVYGEAVDYRRFKKLTIQAEETQMLNVDGENVMEAKGWAIETLTRVFPLLYHEPGTAGPAAAAL